MHTDLQIFKKTTLVIDDNTFSKVISVVKSLEIIEYECHLVRDIESLNELIYTTYKIEDNEHTHI